VSGHSYVFNFGKLLTHGAQEAVRNNPDVIKAYIGEEDR